MGRTLIPDKDDSLQKYFQSKPPQVIKRRYLGLPWNQFLMVVLCILPAFLHLAVFWMGSQVMAIYQGFTDQETNLFTLKNYTFLYEQLTSADSTLILAFSNTLKYFVKNVAMIPVGLFVAYMFYKKMFGHIFVRLVLFIPPAVMGLMYVYSYKFLISDISPVIKLMRELGIQMPQDLLAHNATKMIMVFDIWTGICGGMIIWFGAMSRIPNELVEYAIFDGVTPLQEFGYITMPLIWPTVVTVSMFTFMGVFSASGSVLALTQGRYNSTTFSYWCYEAIYRLESYGFQNRVVATGHVIAFLTLPVVLGCRWIMNRFGEEVEY